jgi:type IV pilus assembly protein PilQ
MTSRRRLAAGLAALTLWGLAFSAWAAPTLTAMTFTDQGAGRLDVGLDFVGGVPEIRGYRTEAPPRLALDLLQAQSGLTQSSFAIGSAGVDSVRVLGAGARTRLVFDLASPTDYRLERLDDKVIVHFGDEAAPAATDASPERSAAALPRQPEVSSIDFRRGEDGAGQLDLALDRAGVAAEVSGQGRQVSVSLPGVTLPDAQYQTLDVSGFGTAVERIVPRRSADGVTFDIVASDAVEPLVTQNGRRFTIELAPAGSLERPETDSGPSYTGHRITLDFQDIPVRDVLSIIAEESGLNVVASDSVQGNVTLNLTDVPWDQALDLVLRNHGLSARREGNVMMVAPTGELANLQRQTLETREQTKQLAPLATEFLQIRYAKAEDLAALLRGGEGVGMMSERGRVTVDPRTNTLILQDTREQLDAIRRTIEHLDVPVRQVQIEARIVIARDSATRELGVNGGSLLRRVDISI